MVMAWRAGDGRRMCELHYIGKVQLEVQVQVMKEIVAMHLTGQRTAEFGQTEDPDGDDYCDCEYERPMISHPFYVYYERSGVAQRVDEKVSFRKALVLLNRNTQLISNVIRRGMIPYQHPAVVYSEYCSCDRMQRYTGYSVYYDWMYVRQSRCNGELIGSFIRDLEGHGEIEGDVLQYVPPGLFKPLYRHAPYRILRVLGMTHLQKEGCIPNGCGEYVLRRFDSTTELGAA